MADQMETDEYRRIRVLWPDHLNLARGKYLPHRLAAQGTRHSLTVFALGYDREYESGARYRFPRGDAGHGMPFRHIRRKARMGGRRWRGCR